MKKTVFLIFLHLAVLYTTLQCKKPDFTSVALLSKLAKNNITSLTIYYPDEHTLHTLQLSTNSFEHALLFDIDIVHNNKMHTLHIDPYSFILTPEQSPKAFCFAHFMPDEDMNNCRENLNAVQHRLFDTHNSFMQAQITFSYEINNTTDCSHQIHYLLQKAGIMCTCTYRIEQSLYNITMPQTDIIKACDHYNLAQKILQEFAKESYKSKNHTPFVHITFTFVDGSSYENILFDEADPYLLSGKGYSLIETLSQEEQELCHLLENSSYKQIYNPYTNLESLISLPKASSKYPPHMGILLPNISQKANLYEIAIYIIQLAILSW